MFILMRLTWMGLMVHVAAQVMVVILGLAPSSRFGIILVTSYCCWVHRTGWITGGNHYGCRPIFSVVGRYSADNRHSNGPHGRMAVVANELVATMGRAILVFMGSACPCHDCRIHRFVCHLLDLQCWGNHPTFHSHYKLSCGPQRLFAQCDRKCSRNDRFGNYGICRTGIFREPPGAAAR